VRLQANTLDVRPTRLDELNDASSTSGLVAIGLKVIVNVDCLQYICGCEMFRLNVSPVECIVSMDALYFQMGIKAHPGWREV